MIETQIKLGGEERTLRFDVGTMKLIAQKTKEDALDPLKGLEGYIQALYVCYFGMVRFYVYQKQKQDFTIDDMADWVDSLSYQEMLYVMKSYSDAYTVQSDESAPADDGSDKKK